MSFLVPWFAAFAVLAAVPIAIHLLGRPRAERRKFAAMAFLLRSDRKVAARNRLRELLLLVARAALIALVPLLLAKPVVELASDLPGGLGATESAVIVLDDTLSMGPLFERARERARRIVVGLGHDSEAAILLTSRGAAPLIGDLATDRARLAEALAKARPTRKSGDTTAALKRAAAILAAGNHARRRVYLVSDLAAHGFSGEPPWGDGGPELVPVDPAGGDARPNRAVVAVTADPAPELGPRGVRVSVEIANFAAEPAQGVPVTLRIDGKAVAKGLVEIPARGRTTKRFFHRFGGPAEAPAAGAAPGARPPLVHDGLVELDRGVGRGGGPDALPDDDGRAFRVDERRSVKVLVVDGDPRTVRRDDEVFFLETALHPGDADDFRFDVAVVSPDELARRVAAARRAEPAGTGIDAEVVFLANVKAPDTVTAGALAAFVKQGGGLFLSVGANVDVEGWNAALRPLLPQPLAGFRTVGATREGRADGEARQGGPGERIDRWGTGHPVLEPFRGGAQGAGEGLREARVARFALLQPTPQGAGEARQVLLRLDSGAPLLVEGRHGAGRVLLLATTADRDWTDLPMQPAWLPLVEQSVRYLAGAAMREPDPPALVGAPHRVPLAEGDTRVEVTPPSGKARAFGPDKVGGRRALEFTGTDEPGIYRVAAGSSFGALAPREAAAFAVGLDPAESDLLRVEKQKLASLWRPAAPGQTAAAPKRRVELWHALGAGLLLLLLVEGLLAIRRT